MLHPPFCTNVQPLPLLPSTRLQLLPLSAARHLRHLPPSDRGAMVAFFAQFVVSPVASTFVAGFQTLDLQVKLNALVWAGVVAPAGVALFFPHGGFRNRTRDLLRGLVPFYALALCALAGVVSLVKKSDKFYRRADPGGGFVKGDGMGGWC